MAAAVDVRHPCNFRATFKIRVTRTVSSSLAPVYRELFGPRRGAAIFFEVFPLSYYIVSARLVVNFWLRASRPAARVLNVAALRPVPAPPPPHGVVAPFHRREKCTLQTRDGEMINDYPFTFLVEPFSLPVHLLYIFRVRVVN